MIGGSEESVVRTWQFVRASTDGTSNLPHKVTNLGDATTHVPHENGHDAKTEINMIFPEYFLTIARNLAKASWVVLLPVGDGASGVDGAGFTAMRLNAL